MAVMSDEGENGQGQGQARARASKGEGVQTRDETRRMENREQRKMVAAQQAHKSLHSWGSYGKRGGMRPQLPSILIYSDLMILDKARLGYLYYNGYSMHKVSKKKEKIK